MKLRHIYILLVSVLLPALGGCSPEEQGPAPTRVLLAYVGADSNLSPFAQGKLDALQSGWTGLPTDHIIAYADTRSGAQLLELSVPANTAPRVLAQYGKENSADPATLARVIEHVTTLYRAEVYGLLIFSHASGWLPGGNLENPRKSSSPHGKSVIIDGGDEIELLDFAEAIPDRVFDYIAFETCFMAGIEVAYQLRHKADYIFASSAEIVHPGFGPAYGRATAHLLGGDMRRFGQTVFGHILTYDQSDPGRSSTLSVIRTAGLEPLAEFVAAHCRWERSVEVADVQRFDRNEHRLFFDFGDYHSRLLETHAERAELSCLIDDCIPWRASTPTFMTQSPLYNGFTITRHCGLTTYIPQPQFQTLNKKYTNTDWAQKVQTP